MRVCDFQKGGVLMIDTICQAVEKFLKSNSIKYRYNKDMVERLFNGYAKSDLKKNSKKKERASSFAFLLQKSINNTADKKISDLHIQEYIAAAIKESASAYTRDKRIAMCVYKDFIDFIYKEYQINIPVEFPPVFSSEFSRQMYIVKEILVK